jgi:small subunit ribosomal protein S20
MPILKHAKKKLKQDKKRTIKNKKIKDTFKSLLKKAKADKSPKAVSLAFSAVDKAAKKNVLSKNKAAHLKASLSKQISSKGTSAAAAPKEKPAKAAAVKKKESKPATKATKSTGAKAKKPSSKK